MVFWALAIDIVEKGNAMRESDLTTVLNDNIS